ncbi:MAG: VC0807 family protein [Akkermansia sp.]|nr:VC0807 family protein [Akkermansia sp.]
MDQGTKSLLNVVLSVLAPVLVLDHCSTEGPGLLELGTTWAMVVALALPIGCGIWTFIDTRRVDPITLFGLLGTILTGVVTVYANTGDGGAIRPDTPWWYAAKEGLIPMLLCGAVLVTARRRDSMLRLFVYSDAIFDIPAIEKAVEEKSLQPAYAAVLWRASVMMALTLLASAAANFCLALHFLLPVLQEQPAKQALAYNYAVSSMTWWGYLVIGVPLLGTLVGVIRFLLGRLSKLTGLESVTNR